MKKSSLKIVYSHNYYFFFVASYTLIENGLNKTEEKQQMYLISSERQHLCCDHMNAQRMMFPAHITSFL